MKSPRLSNSILLIYSIALSAIVHIATLISPNRLSYAGGDVYFNIWTYKINWNYLNSFNNDFLNHIQFPEKGSAFTGELQLGNMLLFKFLNSFLNNDIQTYAWILTFSGICIFFSTFKIAKLLGAQEFTSLIFATYCTSAMFLADHISHIQVTSFYWLTIPIWQFLELSKTNPSFKILRKCILFLSILLLFAGPSYLNIVLGFSVGISILILFCSALSDEKDLISAISLRCSHVKMFLKPTFRVISSALLIASLFWIPYILQVVQKDNVRSVLEVSQYRVDLSQFLNPSSNNWLYGEHSLATSALRGDSLFPGLFVFGMIIFGLLKSRPKIFSLQFYIFSCGIFLILLSLTSPITLFGDSVLPNPLFLLMAKIGFLSATRYLPTLAFFGFLLVFLASILKIHMFTSWKTKRVQVIAFFFCALVVFENSPNSASVLPTQPRLSSDWRPLEPVLLNAKTDYVGIYPGPSLPLSTSDPLFWTQFEWMSGLANIPLRFIGGNAGFFSNQGLEMMEKLQKQEFLKEIPLKNCLIKLKCILIIDKNGLKQFNSGEQLRYIQQEAEFLKLPIIDFREFVVIGVVNQDKFR
jgi:hypothetical protein